MQRLAFSLSSEINRFQSLFNIPIAAISFTNLFLMDANNATFVDIHGEKLIVYHDWNTSEAFCTLVVDTVDNTSVDELTSHNVPVIVWCNTFKEKLINKHGFVKDFDNAEYIYSVDKTLSLDGKAYQSVRRKINICSRENEIKISSLDTSYQDAIWALAERSYSDVQALSLNWEKDALEKAFLFQSKLKLDAVGIFIDNKLEAFSLVEKPYKETVVVHFFKSNKDYTGLAESLFLAIAQTYKEQARYLNFEQDLGLHGLQQFKRSLRPYRQILPYFQT